MTEFTLPELGENIEKGDVVRVLVKPGDTLERDQPVVELETDKATIEVPSTLSGVVKEVRVKAGDKVTVGQAILVVDESAEAEAPKAAAGGRAATNGGEDGAQASPAPRAGQADAAAEGGLAQDVQPRKDGQGQDAASRGEQEREEGAGQTDGAASAQSRPAGRVVDISAGRPAPTPTAPVPAAPSTRRYARELGLDIGAVPGTGPGGRISTDDVKAHARRVISGSGGAAAPAPLPDFSKWGEVERQPMRSIRRKTAERMAATWATVPHVTQGDKADITALEQLRQKYAARAEAAGGKLTMTAIAIKVVATALKVFPEFNASIDVANEEIVLKKYVHIGVAVDTEAGLLVPVIRDADRKNLVEISVELSEIAQKAKARKLTLEEMEGGSFTITNLGGIGGTYFTPIVNAPEVAILGMSRSATEPIYAEGQLQPRLMLPLSLSYDHRVIDGAHAIRFLRWVCEAFEQPFVMSLQG